MRKLYMGTNTKMYKTIADTVFFLERLQSLTADISRDALCLFVIPSFTALARARSVIKDDAVLLGAQNMCWEDEGQFTGEISPVMLKEVGVTIAEIGHSERRHIFGETDEEENKKMLAALTHGLSPLLCVGETETQKKFGVADETLAVQLKIGLHNVPVQMVSRCIIAYEPVWAIGVSGKPASKEYTEERHKAIKRTLRHLYGDPADAIPVLYGGSVNKENAERFLLCEGVDGLFIGRSAWDADSFNDIIRLALRVQKARY